MSNSKQTAKTPEKKPSYNPAKTLWGKIIVVILCAAMVLIPLICVIVMLCSR